MNSLLLEILAISLALAMIVFSVLSDKAKNKKLSKVLGGLGILSPGMAIILWSIISRIDGTNGVMFRGRGSSTATPTDPTAVLILGITISSLAILYIFYVIIKKPEEKKEETSLKEE